LKVEDRKFVFTVSAAFIVLAGVIALRGRTLPAMVPAALAALLMLTSVLLPRTIPAIHRGWMAGAHAISRVTTPIVLGIVYYLVLTPTGLIRRMAGRSSLRKAGPPPRSGPHTYWVSRAVRARPPGDMRRQF
jgi:hypothetical protein